MIIHQPKGCAPQYIFKLLLLVFILFCNIGTGNSSCAFQGACHQHNERAFGPCVPEEGRTFPLITHTAGDESYAKLERLCPHLLTGNKTRLCCSQSQAIGLSNQIKQAESILARCPSCLDNFLKIWCEFSCSPRQSDFVTILEKKPIMIEENSTFVPEKNNMKYYANEMEYRISETFMNGTFNSCKDVTFGGNPALRMMCSTPCTLDNWLRFLGTQNLPIGIPLNIKFTLIEPPVSAYRSKRLINHQPFMDVKFTKCSEEVRPGSGTCSMLECNREQFEKLLSFDNMIDDSEGCSIHGIECTKVFLVLMFIAGTTMLLCVGFVYTSYTEELERFRRVGENGRIKRTGVWIQQFLQINSKEIGEMAGRNPKAFFLVGCTVMLFCLPGMVYHKESRDLLDMWSSPQSRARQEENLFNTHFGRNPRYNQIMLMTTNQSLHRNESTLPGAVYRKEILSEMFDILADIRSVSAIDKEGRVITLDDVCYRPMGPGYDCLIMSPTNYFQGNKELLDFEMSAEDRARYDKKKEKEKEDDFDYYADENDYKTPTFELHMKECIDNPTQLRTSVGLSCFGTYGGPSYPNLILSKTKFDKNVYLAKAMMMTILVTQRNEVEIEKARLWEQAFLDYCKSRPYNLSSQTTISFMAERSILDEIDKDSKEEVLTIVIALLFLLGYVTFSLGRYYVCENSLITIMVHSRVVLGVTSVIITTFSSFCSWGIWSMSGVHPVKSALAVQFFLVTLLGVSRTFMVVKYYATIRVTYPYMGPERLPEIVGMVTAWTMPAVICSSVSAAFCFFVGSFTFLPAIKSFCLYAGLAIIIDAILHCTLFLALFVWDTERELNGKVEIFMTRKIHDLPAAHLIGRQTSTDTYLTHMFKLLAPFLVMRKVIVAICVIFILSFIASVILSSDVSVGFDQRMAFTTNSYISSHFNNLEQYFDIGPPIYFVVDGELDWHKPEIQNKFCTFSGCDQRSLGNIMNFAVTKTNHTMLSHEVFNWIDSYLQWIARESPCCRVFVNDPTSFCSTNNIPAATNSCRSCMDYDVVANSFLKGSLEWIRPSKNFFYKHLHHFLEDTPNPTCIFGGRASFKDAISFTSRGRIQTSHFMTFNQKLAMSNSTAFVDAIQKARSVANIMAVNLNDTARVFAYGKIFPYYEQYTTILKVLTSQLAITVVGTFSIICLALGIDVKGAACAVICQISNYFHIVAQMYLFSIPVNAISGTVLIMSSGVLLEFSVNILKGYASSERSEAHQRAQETIARIAPIIVAGPVFSMAGSTLFLSGAHLQIINVYFCKLVLITIISSAVHALIFLPCLLSFGGSTSHRNRINTEDKGSAGGSPQPPSFENVENEVLCEAGKNSPSLNSLHLLDPLLERRSAPIDLEDTEIRPSISRSTTIKSIQRALSSASSSSSRSPKKMEAPKAVCEIDE